MLLMKVGSSERESPTSPCVSWSFVQMQLQSRSGPIDTHFTSRSFHAEKDWCTGRTKSFQNHLHFNHSILHQLDDLRNISVCEMSLRKPFYNGPDVIGSSLALKNSTNFPNNSSQWSFIWMSAPLHMPNWITEEPHIWFSPNTTRHASEVW